MLNRLTIILAWAACLALTSHGQVPIPTIVTNNFAQQFPEFDTSIAAVVLSENYQIDISRETNNYRQRYSVHRFVKVLKQNGENGTAVKDYLLQHANQVELLTDFNCRVYTLVDGKIKQTILDKNAVRYGNTPHGYYEMKFTLDNATPGSILEIQYEIVGNLRTLLPTWEWQNALPKLQTSLKIAYPKNLKMEPHWLGTTSMEAELLLRHSVSTEHNQVTESWLGSSLPAIKQEPFITGVENYYRRLVLELGQSHHWHRPDSLWKKLNEELWQNEHFGGLAADSVPLLRQRVDSVTKQLTSGSAKARSIYSYVRDVYENNNNSGIAARHETEQLLSHRSASPAEINLLLCAMLRYAGLAAQPVILGRLGGTAPSHYLPMLQRFNYTVVRMTIGDSTYMLDASNRFNAFGYLPIYCYNGYARVVTSAGGYPIELTNTDLEDKLQQTVRVTSITPAHTVLKIEEQKGAIESNYWRNVLTTDTGAMSKYIKRNTRELGEVDILFADVKNLYEPEKPLIITYTIKAKTRMQQDNILIPLQLLKVFQRNPFASDKRQLPIYFPSRFNSSYTMQVELPKGYLVSQVPEAKELKTPGNELHYKSLIMFDKERNLLKVFINSGIDAPTLYPSNYSFLQLYFKAMLDYQHSFISIRSAG
jgi:hypothetical protein